MCRFFIFTPASKEAKECVVLMGSSEQLLLRQVSLPENT
jgi:hypothetical protein